ncbi:MAG: FkbM family methyltransferase [Flavisolibacter sp.]|nr:FkbM family methyltransferase [Flavisolibacter sp.]
MDSQKIILIIKLMKQRIRRYLLKKGIYDYVKYSQLFRLYERLLKPEVKQAFQREYQFYQSFLTPCSLIFDIGAYDGHKTDVFLQWADKVVCCEPDPKNFHTLQVRFRNDKHRVFIENVAVASVTTIREMFVHHAGSAFNTLNEKFMQVTEADQVEKWDEKIQYESKRQVSTTTLNDLIAKYGKPYFIKIDVEGYELEVVKGLSQRVPYLRLECLFPYFAEELKQSMEWLHQLDPGVHFNIAVQEQLLLSKFLPFSQMQDYLASFNQHHFELIVKMKME